MLRLFQENKSYGICIHPLMLCHCMSKGQVWYNYYFYYYYYYYHCHYYYVIIFIVMWVTVLLLIGGGFSIGS